MAANTTLQPFVLHIPHAHHEIPDAYRSDFLLSDDELAYEMRIMADHGTDSLFLPLEKPAECVTSPWSRLFVDMERFRDDHDEDMSQLGMGVLYEKTASGKPMRHPPTPAIREKILRDYYDTHHNRLTKAVDARLEHFGWCLIIDCHSFPKESLPYEDANWKRPEICLGCDDFHTPQVLRDLYRHAFESGGFDVAINEPFKGSLVPLKHYRKDPRVLSIMLEARRDLYITENNFPEVIYEAFVAHKIRERASSALDGALAYYGKAHL